MRHPKIKLGEKRANPSPTAVGPSSNPAKKAAQGPSARGCQSGHRGRTARQGGIRCVREHFLFRSTAARSPGLLKRVRPLLDGNAVQSASRTFVFFRGDFKSAATGRAKPGELTVLTSPDTNRFPSTPPAVPTTGRGSLMPVKSSQRQEEQPDGWPEKKRVNWLNKEKNSLVAHNQILGR